MSKSLRFFEIIQMLRGADKPLLARDMASTLEVSVRTIYRDIASLQSMQTPIYGEAGIGYVLRRGYDLPPLNLDIDEAEAVSVGLSLIARTGDPALWKAAGRAARKLQRIAPGTRQLIASSWGIDEPMNVDLGFIRESMRAEQKLEIRYQDVSGATTDRVVWPLALIYSTETALLVSWCERRTDFRHFRLDRVLSCCPHAEAFAGRGAQLLQRWENTQKDNTVTTRPSLTDVSAQSS